MEPSHVSKSPENSDDFACSRERLGTLVKIIRSGASGMSAPRIPALEATPTSRRRQRTAAAQPASTEGTGGVCERRLKISRGPLVPESTRSTAVPTLPAADTSHMQNASVFTAPWRSNRAPAWLRSNAIRWRRESAFHFHSDRPGGHAETPRDPRCLPDAGLYGRLPGFTLIRLTTFLRSGLLTQLLGPVTKPVRSLPAAVWPDCDSATSRSNPATECGGCKLMSIAERHSSSHRGRG